MLEWVRRIDGPVGEEERWRITRTDPWNRAGRWWCADGFPQAPRRASPSCTGTPFGRKLGPVLNPPETAREFIAAHLHHDRGVAALVDGEVVGVAGYQRGGRAPTGGGARSVLSTYGTFRGIPRLLLLALFSRTPAAHELVMDGIAVSPRPAHRGRGIGSLLLAEIATLAADHDCRRIRLDVIDVDPRARALCERHGFTAARTERTPYLRGLLGFSAVTTTYRPVTAADGREER
ncbi:MULTISPECIES: GNAT family N-acetyltransferase [unclassified Streptomyces]|uniref:GNAT family N-acetyltransferase n=1 Tax=unclassified Streptomyces TaxID=2593676 RepID=UPI00380535E3